MTTAPMTRLRSLSAACLLSVLVALAACGGDQAATPEDSDAPAAGREQASSSAPLTGTIIEVTMHTNDKGNYFEPANFTAKEGDVVRFKLVTGVHNVHFLPDSNKSAERLPPMSAFFQLPGQTLDVPMTFGEGVFYYQCDPHALLGMVGRITVEDDN